MSDTIESLIASLDQAKSDDDIDHVVKALADLGEIVVEPLVQHVESLRSSHWMREKAIMVLRALAYPANRDGIGFMIGEASNANAPAWGTALDTLREIGEPVIPELQIAFDNIKSISPARDRRIVSPTNDLFVLLEHIGSPTIDPLLPYLLYFLEIGTKEFQIDRDVLLPIGAIGSPKANAAIPLIRKRILENRDEYMQRTGIEVLRHFEPDLVEPLLPILKDCLYDPSERIRASAAKILEHFKQ